MRTSMTQSLLRIAEKPDFVFLTGDLGFMALEPLQEKLGRRFINAGISEQNMVSMAGGLARAGWKPWVYSIAPFIYARPLEQIRNDVCFHRLPVVLVGNGGGYAYGVMGPSHHALEDVGILSSLPGMRCFLPAFSEDLPPITELLSSSPGPGYLRLGRDEKPREWTPPPYAAWRRLVAGQGPTVVAVGPLVGGYLEALASLPLSRRARLWALTEFPLLTAEPPEAFWEDVRSSGTLVVAEEHVSHGGVGEALAHLSLTRGVPIKRFVHLSAQGYPSGQYGSQAFHRAESRLDKTSLLGELERNDETRG
jgi:transketolase